MKDYIVLDLETPNKYANSMSSIGIVVVEDNEVVDEIYSLINPEAEFDSFNIAFTGIHPEDVEDAPTFPEYYEEIKDLLLNNIIVGQNITFDLSVISKAMTRYNMPIPPFEYYCTLNSCKRNLSLPENSLSYVVKNVLNTTYDAHNAMADAQMTNELFNYLDDFEDNRRDYLKTYYYRPNCKRDFDRNFDYNYNYLYGLIQKFSYINTLSDNYIELLEKWFDSNKCNNTHPLIENVLLKVSYIIYCDNLSQNETHLIVNSLNPIKRSPKYKVVFLRLHVLKGIIDSVTCEEEITQKDIDFITDWLDSRNINDKSFKKFYKELDVDNIDKFKEQISNYSSFLEDYLE